MEQKKYEYDVFISYSRKDLFDEQNNVIPNNEVSKIMQALSDAGITYWIDKEGINYGEAFTTKIIQNIKASKLFLFLSSRNSNYNSEWTSGEIASACELNKYIIPVRIDSSKYSDGLMVRIANLNYIPYHINPEQGRIEMVNTIKKQLGCINQESQEQIAELSQRNSALKSVCDNLRIEIKRKGNIIKAVSILAALFAFGLIGCTLYQLIMSKNKVQEPMLVFAGGGSVYNYILEHPVNGDTIDLRSYDNAIYINQPSGNAWTLLFEEAMSDKKNFCAVCLSADVIDTTDLVQKYTAFAEKARIVQLLIGHDPLMVYADKKLSSSIFGNDNNITPHRLCEIIKDSTNYTLRLFSTTRDSGTFRTYNNYFSKDENDPKIEYLYDSKQCPPFYEDAKPDYLRALNNVDKQKEYRYFLVLGSKYYKPKNKDVIGTYNSLIVKDNNSDYILQKPIYLYFIARMENNQFKINDRIITFLKKIDATKYIEQNCWNSMNNDNGHIASDGKLIISINDTTISPYTNEIARLNHLESFSSR